MMFTANPVRAINFSISLMVEDPVEMDFQQQLEFEFSLRISFLKLFFSINEGSKYAIVLLSAFPKEP